MANVLARPVPRCARALAAPTLAALALAAATTPALAAPGRASFEQAFSTAGEPARLHYTVAFVSRGAPHRLEVWRDGDRRVKRVTDGAVTTFAFHRPGSPDFKLSILDARRRIHTRIDRTDMYRIGQFTDWFDLTHGLRHPKAAYVLTAGSAPAGAPRPVRACTWWDLTQGARTVHVCWSPTVRLPLLIVDPRAPPGPGSAAGVVWRVASVSEASAPPGAFRIHDRGYVRNDADDDISQD